MFLVNTFTQLFSVINVVQMTVRQFTSRYILQDIVLQAVAISQAIRRQKMMQFIQFFCFRIKGTVVVVLSDPAEKVPFKPFSDQ